MPHDHQNPLALSPELRDAIERAADELFVGRGRELIQLDAALKDALGGRGRVLLIAGEPGIGKTRLVERVAAAAMKQGADVLWGRCWEGEGAPVFWPWLQIARSHLRTRGSASIASRIGIGAPYVAQVLPEIRDLLPDLPAAPPLDSEQARFRLYDAVSTFLIGAAADKPLVLVLDDLHWADKSSLLLLQFLAREIVDARLCVLATYRDVEVSAAHPLGEVLPNLRRERTVDRILLRGLPEEEVRTLLVALRGGDVPPTFTANLARETGGNPFFIKEILRHLLDEGVAYRQGDHWETRADEREIRLPESVREVVGRRLARLGDPCRKVLTVASVIGTEFAFEALERASGGPEDLLGLLEEAISARVLEEVPQSIGRYRFSHALIRETLYEEIRTVERVRLHRVVAGALERLFARDPDAHLPELAHHFLEALPGGDVGKAVDYASRAGDRAGEQLAHDNAALLYGRALQALELAESVDERLRCELLLKLGEAQWSAGGFRDPGEQFRKAAEIAERLQAPELFARAALGLGGPGVLLGAERQVEHLEKALATLEDKDTPLRARVMAALVSRRHFRETAAKYARPALEMARRLGEPATLAYVLDGMMWGTWGPALDLGERLDLTQEMITVAEEAGDPKLAAAGHLWRASHYLEIGDVANADRDVDAQLRIAEGSREPYHRWLAAITRAAKAFRGARLDEAESHLAEGTTSASKLWGFGADSRVIRLDWGVGPAIRRERRPPGDEDVDTYQTLLAKFAHPTWHIVLTWTLLGADRIDACRENWQRVAAHDFANVPHDLNWLDSISRASEIASRLDDAPRARILYDLLLPHARRCMVRLTVCFGAVGRPLGLLATTLARFDDAERHFVEALEINERIGATVWVAHTQSDYARMLLTRNRRGDREKATDLAAKALATARESGMHVLEQTTVAMLDAAGLDAGSEQHSAATARPSLESRFVREGDLWSIAYEGKMLRLKDSKGLQYIAALIARENQEIHAFDLAVGGDAGERLQDRGNAGEVLDAQARSEYRERLRDLESELEEATRWNDAGRAARLTEEIDFLKGELGAAFGTGGRARKAADSTERARKAVASRIRDAIERIGREHRALAVHLENAIRTGTFCCYRPDRSPGWKV